MISLKKRLSQFNEIKRHFLPKRNCSWGKNFKNGLEITKNELLCSAFSLLLWLSDSLFSPFISWKKATFFFENNCKFFLFVFCVLKAGLCRFFVHFACLFIVVIYILIVLWIAKLHPEKKKKNFWNTVLESILCCGWQYVC